MKTILVLTNFSQKATNAEFAALNIAIAAKSDILLFHSVVYPETNPEVFSNTANDTLLLEDQITQCFTRSIERLKVILSKKEAGGYKPKIRTMQGSGDLGLNVSEIVAENDIWMVVLGSKESDNGLSNFLFGSCAFNVINNVNCPVLLVPEKANLQNIKKIALATDLPKFGPDSIGFLADFVEPYDSKLLVTHVSPVGWINLEDIHVDTDVNIPLAQLPDFSKSRLMKRIVEKDFDDFIDEADIDVLVILHYKNNLFKKIFHSGFTQILIKHTSLAIMILPCDE